MHAYRPMKLTASVLGVLALLAAGVSPVLADPPIGKCDIVGTEGDDTLSGDGALREVFCGLGGNDTIYAGDDDSVYGGPGNDTIVGGKWFDAHGGRGNDTIQGGLWSYLDGGPGADTLVLDYVLGEDDQEAPNGWHAQAFGRHGRDRLVGGPGRDFLWGGRDGDIILGGAGADFLNGAHGRDTIRGGAGNDQLLGGAGDDRLFGEDGNDWLDGSHGADVLHGGEGHDDLEGDGTWGIGKRDVLVGGPGDDDLHGGPGGDRLVGGTGNDVPLGWRGNDRLIGGPGQDRMVGHGGRDSFEARDSERDRLYGGAGVDTAASDPVSTVCGASRSASRPRLAGGVAMSPPAVPSVAGSDLAEERSIAATDRGQRQRTFHVQADSMPRSCIGNHARERWLGIRSGRLCI